MSDEAEDQEVDEAEENALVDIDLDEDPPDPGNPGRPFPTELEEHLSDPLDPDDDGEDAGYPVDAEYTEEVT